MTYNTCSQVIFSKDMTHHLIQIISSQSITFAGTADTNNLINFYEIQCIIELKLNEICACVVISERSRELGGRVKKRGEEGEPPPRRPQQQQQQLVGLFVLVDGGVERLL